MQYWCHVILDITNCAVLQFQTSIASLAALSIFLQITLQKMLLLFLFIFVCLFVRQSTDCAKPDDSAGPV